MKNFLVKLEGKSQLHEPVIKSEGITVNIWSVDRGSTWENKDIILNVAGTLEIYMFCKAMSGTSWESQLERMLHPLRLIKKELSSNV